MVELQDKSKKLADVVISFFAEKKGIDVAKVHTRNRILGYIWYIVHYTYNEPISKIMRDYGVTRCWVFRIISRTKYRISNCKVEIQEFVELTEYLQNQGLYPIYE